MSDAEKKARYVGVVQEFRKSFEENGYLPHKAALRLIEIAEELLND